MTAGRPRKLPDSKGRWKCSHCKEYKYPYEYYPNDRAKNGLGSQCRVCMKRYQTEYARGNRFQREWNEFVQVWPSAPDEMLNSLTSLTIERSMLAETNADFYSDQIYELSKRIEMTEMSLRMMGADQPPNSSDQTPDS